MQYQSCSRVRPHYSELLEQFSQAVTHVRVQGSNVSVALKFPVIPNIDWAFLMGLWFGAGGYVTRFREGKAQEKTLRFAVDPRPYRELMNPLLLRLGYSSHEPIGGVESLFFLLG